MSIEDFELSMTMAKKKKPANKVASPPQATKLNYSPEKVEM